MVGAGNGNTERHGSIHSEFWHRFVYPQSSLEPDIVGHLQSCLRSPPALGSTAAHGGIHKAQRKQPIPTAHTCAKN